MSDIAITHNGSAGQRTGTQTTLSNAAERDRTERAAPKQDKNSPSWKRTFAFPAYSGLLEIV